MFSFLVNLEGVEDNETKTSTWNISIISLTNGLCSLLNASCLFAEGAGVVLLVILVEFGKQKQWILKFGEHFGVREANGGINGHFGSTSLLWIWAAEKRHSGHE